MSNHTEPKIEIKSLETENSITLSMKEENKVLEKVLYETLTQNQHEAVKDKVEINHYESGSMNKKKNIEIKLLAVDKDPTTTAAFVLALGEAMGMLLKAAGVEDNKAIEVNLKGEKSVVFAAQMQGGGPWDFHFTNLADYKNFFALSQRVENGEAEIENLL